ncbi:MAG TPA: glycosyltransferase [Caldimonas sp.]|nr:glycosyltransferase [Caldimonas sp.]
MRGTVAEPLHVVDTTMFWSATGGGVRRYLRTKHAWLARQPGWRHTIAVPSADAREPAGVVSLPALPIPWSGGYRWPWRRAAIARRLTALAPDLIEAGDPFVTGWAAVDAARRRDVPALAYCHSNIERMAVLFAGRAFASTAARAARAHARRTYARFDRVLAPSQSMCRHLEDWGVPRVAVQPLGVDTTVFHPACRSRTWRHAHGFQDADRVLVYAGRFAPEKHLDVLAAAVDRLGPPYTFLAIGAGPCPPRGARVRVLPFQHDERDLAMALASADLFVHAGDQETFGLSALEAMACGLPVVARHAEGLAEVVDDSVGAGVERNDAALYAEAIRAAIDAGGGGRASSARARAERHDWSQVLTRLLVHYRELVGTRVAGAQAADRFDGASADAHTPMA